MADCLRESIDYLFSNYANATKKPFANNATGDYIRNSIPRKFYETELIDQNKYDIKANKRFGQNFLIDDNILENIVSSEGTKSGEIISITIVAFATSLPELLTSINATKKGVTDMAIGNIIGSQIFNIFLIVGASAFLCPIKYSVHYNLDMGLLLFGTIIFAIFPFIGKKHYMSKANGIFFVLIYAIYIIYSINVAI